MQGVEKQQGKQMNTLSKQPKTNTEKKIYKNYKQSACTNLELGLITSANFSCFYLFFLKFR